MNINIYLEEELAAKLSICAAKMHKKRNSIVREAIKEWLTKHTEHKWPESVMQFNGITDFPSINELRQNLIEPQKDLFK